MLCQETEGSIVGEYSFGSGQKARYDIDTQSQDDGDSQKPCESPQPATEAKPPGYRCIVHQRHTLLLLPRHTTSSIPFPIVSYSIRRKMIFDNKCSCKFIRIHRMLYARNKGTS